MQAYRFSYSCKVNNYTSLNMMLLDLGLSSFNTFMSNHHFRFASTLSHCDNLFTECLSSLYGHSHACYFSIHNIARNFALLIRHNHVDFSIEINLPYIHSFHES